MMDSILKANLIEVEDFFFNNTIKSGLLSDIGENNLKDLIELLSEDVRNPNGKGFSSKKLQSSQLRKFYDGFLRVFNARGMSEDQKKVELLMLKANVEYSANRSAIKTKRFAIFLNNRINLVLSKNGDGFNKYLNALKLHFEALVGYYPKVGN
ncbi:MAG: type III-A CRISPR-associated protein Csm2 [Melioribacteraceae bacterium]|nr:type III-A CRISPR-associated protein Csm2 [Melioribacteraceae bacterium]